MPVLRSEHIMYQVDLTRHLTAEVSGSRKFRGVRAKRSLLPLQTRVETTLIIIHTICHQQ